MNVNDFLDKLKDESHKEILLESTVRYLSSLPDTLENAAYHAAILRWFNEEVLSGILKSDVSVDDEYLSSSSSPSPAQLYEQLQKLPFTEEYPGRGHSFHELTREIILDYLWKERTDFYRQVSIRAVEYFTRIVETQTDKLNRGEIDQSQSDTGIWVELSYHYLITDVESAVAEIGAFLPDLLSENQMGIYHDMIEAVAEHATGGRLSPDWAPFVEFWRLIEAYSNYDFERLENLALELLKVPDTDSFLTLKAQTTWYLADGLRLAAQYAKAREYFEENLRRSRALEDNHLILHAIIGLGDVAFEREEFKLARYYFTDALNFWVQQLRGSTPKDVKYDSDVPLKVFYPSAWHRRELPAIEENQEQKEEGSDHGGDKVVPFEKPEVANQEPRFLYFVEIDIDSGSIDALDTEKDEAPLPEWPITIDTNLAELWFKLGLVQERLDQYNLATNCARLAAMMFIDLGDLSRAQSALTMLERLANAIGDQEYVRSTRDLRDQLISEAIQRSDQIAALYGLIDQAESYYFSEDMSSLAREKYEAAYALAEKLELDNGKATCFEGLARLSWTDGDYAEAETLFKRALDLYQQLTNKHSQASILMSLGDLSLQQRRITDAIDSFDAALEKYRVINSASGQFDTLLSLSDAAKTSGRYEEAFSYLKQTLELARKDEGLLLEATALSEIGKLYLSLGNDTKAKEAFDKALDISRRIGKQSLTTQILLDEVNILVCMAEYARVVELSDKVIEIDPSIAEAYREKGWALQHLGQQHALECKQTFEKAADLVSDNWMSHREIANILSLTGEYEAANKKYRWIVNQIEKSKIQSSLPTLGWCYYKLGEYEKAEEIFRKVVSSDPDPISDYFDLGLVLMCLGDYTEALHGYKHGITHLDQKYPLRHRLNLIFVAKFDLEEEIKKTPKLANVKECLEVKQLLTEAWISASSRDALTIEIQMDNADRCNHRARFYAKLGDEQAALAEYSRAIELQPESAVFYANRAQSYVALTQPDKALSDLTKAIELEPQNADRFFDRANFHTQQKDYSDALDDINQAIELRPKDTTLIVNRAVVYRYLDREEDVLADLSRVIKIVPDSPDGYLIRAEYYAQKGNYQAALSDYSQAIGLRADNYAAFVRRSGVYRALRQYKPALSDLERAIELRPVDVTILALRGRVHAEAGNYQVALGDYTQAIQIKENDPELYAARAKIYAYLEKYQQAIVDLNRSVETQSDRGVYYHFRALSYVDIEDYEAALTDLDTSDKLDRGNENSICYNLMWRGLIYQLTEQNEKAEQVWKKAISIAEALTDLTNKYRLLALATMFLGEVQTAQEQYQSLFDQNPDPYLLYMQRCYLQRAKRLFPARSDISELVAWFEEQTAYSTENYNLDHDG